MSKPQQPTPEHFQWAEAQAKELHRKLPSEFTLKARLSRNGKTQFPDLHFVADSKIPGLFHAQVDPDFIMGRTKRPTEIKVKGSGGDGTAGQPVDDENPPGSA